MRARKTGKQFTVLTIFKLTSKITQFSCSSCDNEKNNDGVDRNATFLPLDFSKLSRIAWQSVSIVFLEYQYWLRSRFSSVCLRKTLFAELSSSGSTRLFFSFWQFLYFECLSEIPRNSLRSTLASSSLTSLTMILVQWRQQQQQQTEKRVSFLIHFLCLFSKRRNRKQWKSSNDER